MMSICRCSLRGEGEFFASPRLPSLSLRGSGVTPMLGLLATAATGPWAMSMVAASCVILIDLVIQIVSSFPRPVPVPGLVGPRRRPSA